jgi:hypothetical protein
MKKFPFLLGAATGFVLGSRAGPGPYNSLASAARRLSERPDVKRVVSKAQDTAQHTRGVAKARAASTLHKGGDGVASTVTSFVRPNARATEDSYVDPQDLQFGTAAAKKAEVLEGAMDRGVDADSLPDEFASARPRAGGKAEPNRAG